MSLAGMGDWAGAVVALVGVIFVVSQLSVQRGQHRLQDAEAHLQQAATWAALADDWETAVLVATGPSAGPRFGVASSKVETYFAVVDRYRLARVGFLVFRDADRVTSEDWEKYEGAVREASDELASYQRSVQKVITHLARVSGLVLRGRLSLDVAYDAFGMQVLRVGDDLRVLMREGYANDTSCPGPLNLELSHWETMTPEKVAGRLGWGDFLDVARGTAERISLFLDLMTVHAIKVGDLDRYGREHFDPIPGEWLAQRDRLAIAWRAGRRSGITRAIRVTWTMSRVGRQARRRRMHWYPKPVFWLLKAVKLYSWDRPLPYNGSLRAPLDSVLSLTDVIRAGWGAKKVPDLRRPDPLWKPDSGPEPALEVISSED